MTPRKPSINADVPDIMDRLRNELQKSLLLLEASRLTSERSKQLLADGQQQKQDTEQKILRHNLPAKSA